MSRNLDAIIIGAGHNALVCATLLARAGQSVRVLERSSQVGGLAADCEFQPGFRAPVAHCATHFPAAIADQLGLAEHGLIMERQPLEMTALSPDGRHVRLRGIEVSGVGDEDRAACTGYMARMERFAAALAPSWMETMPRLAGGKLRRLTPFGRLGWNLRRLGKQDMAELLRVFTLPTRDLVEEHFEHPLLQVLLSWDGLIGSRMAPRSPNNAVPALLYRMAGQNEGQRMLPAGGVSALVAALTAAATAAGVEIRTLTGVSKVELEAGERGLQATGVTLEDGTVLRAKRVVSSADPKTTFLQLLGSPSLEIGFSNRIRRLRSQGLVAKLHLALDALPQFTGLDAPGGRLLIAEDLDHVEFAFDDSKYGRPSNQPVMEVTVPTLQNPALAPEGKHVLSAHVMYAPADIKGGWTYEARKAFSDILLTTLERFAPGIGAQILGLELLTPADIESQFGVTGGHWHHGEFALDQLLMMRPTYEAAQYRTPVEGLWLCGAGCHPGGDLTGAAGHNAAREILRGGRGR